MTAPRPFDASLRSLTTRHMQDFLYWFLGDDAHFEEALDTVFIASERRADFLSSFQDPQGQLKLLHAEFQPQINEIDPAKYPPFRMFEYAAGACRRYGQVPLQVLVLLEDSPAARRVPDFFAEANVRVSYRLIRLWEQDPQVILQSGLIGLLPLVPLMAGSPAELLEESFAALEGQVESREEQIELMGVTALLASIRTSPDAIVSLLRGRAMLNLLEDTPLGQLLLAEREARGRTEGREEGRQTHAVEVNLRLLQHRLGTLPSSVVEQLSLLPLASLDDLSLALLDFSSQLELQAWLDQQG
jgi:predicted transposase YdaD